MISKRLTAGVLGLAGAVALSGCAALIGNATDGLSRNLTAGILDSDDPQTVADGLPAYLLLLDGMIHGDPDNPDLLLAGARLYGAYAGSFAEDPERRVRLALRADSYARRAICAARHALCTVMDAPYDAFEPVVAARGAKDVEMMYGLATAWVGVLQADASDFNRIADLPKVELLLARVVALDPAHDYGSAYMYLGVLNCLRPESLGGNPKKGVEMFDRARERSEGRNQMARVLDAEYCARLTFDQERHDALLNEALAADPKAPGMTLMNTLARQRARTLLESGKDYF